MQPVIYHGQTVKFQSITGIERVTVLGWDEHFIYYKFVYPVDHDTQHPQWQDEFYIEHVCRPFRLGFNRSRLISAEPIQLNLF